MGEIVCAWISVSLQSEPVEVTVFSLHGATLTSWILDSRKVCETCTWTVVMQNDRDFVDVIPIYIQLDEVYCHKTRSQYNRKHVLVWCSQYVIGFAVFNYLNPIYFRTICSLFFAPFSTAAWKTFYSEVWACGSYQKICHLLEKFKDWLFCWCHAGYRNLVRVGV